MIGMGAANVATYRLLEAYGIHPASIIACDSTSILHRGRRDIDEARPQFFDKWRVCTESNADNTVGGPGEALRGADVCIAFSQSGPDVIRPEWIQSMAKDAIVFACANPVPEIWPWEAKEAGARIVCTGRSDFSNQVNNSLGFPGIFRGVLDVRARTITDEMAIAAATELAHCIPDEDLNDENILPQMDEWQVYVKVAVATAMKAQSQGVADITMSEAEATEAARTAIEGARDATRLLMEQGLIPALPPRKELQAA